MKITEYLKENIVYLDGGTGTLLQKMGLSAGELPERWNIEHPDRVIKVHRDYYDAGSNVVGANTFGANILKFSPEELDEIVGAAIENVKKAREESVGNQEKWVSLDIGPTGRMLEPFGDLPFEEAVNIFAQTVKLGVKYGADLISIQTMNDSLETKAALLAVKENSDLPVFVANAYSENGKLMTGANPQTMVAMLEGMGADAIGVNCSFGPEALKPVVEEYLKYASVPVLLKPNAGLPKTVDGKSYYDVLPEDFSKDCLELIKMGVKIAGGCCGTTPEYIAALVAKTKGESAARPEKKSISVVTSSTSALKIGEETILIGKRINPEKNESCRKALVDCDIDYIIEEGLDQQAEGAQIIELDIDIPEIDKAKFIREAVCELQMVTKVPLKISVSDMKALETALRYYNGKAMIDGTKAVGAAEEFFTLVSKYGGVVIYENADKADDILNEAQKYGIDKKDIVFVGKNVDVQAI